jgi:hypothetical protein
MRALYDSVRILAPGVSATSPSANTASAAAAIPNNSSAVAPRYVQVVATVATSIAFGGAAIAATALHAPVVANVPMVFNVMGVTHFSVFQATPGAVMITPLEDF